MRKRRRVAISTELEWGYRRHLEVYAGCQRYADEAGWDCSINPAVDRVLKPGPGHIAYDGVIARVTPSLAKTAQKACVPVVNVWLNSPVQGLPGVFADFETAGSMAAEHLLGRGFRQFGYLGYLRDIDSRLELAGFRAVIRREGFRCTAYRFARSSVAGKAQGWPAFMTDLESWVDSWKRPIGIFVTQDIYCRYLIDVCRSKGLHVPQEVAIVGSANELGFCAAPAPTLTSIDLGYGEIGYRAAGLLDRLMDGKSPPDGPILVPPAELVPRQSTDMYAADDPIVARALRFIGEHGHEPMQVKDVAAAVATTRRTLERRFRESLGRSIAEEITRLRVERAKRRLVESDVSMKVLGRDSGFRNADHFYKVFTRVEGITPTEYRQHRRQQ